MNGILNEKQNTGERVNDWHRERKTRVRQMEESSRHSRKVRVDGRDRIKETRKSMKKMIQRKRRRREQ